MLVTRLNGITGGLVLFFLIFSAQEVRAQTDLKPGINFFSIQQDIDLGKEASRDAEKQLELIRDPNALRYLNELGKRIAQNSKNRELPYEFKLVNSKEINAFAFPGGFIYVNRGTIEWADSESELAGVLGHEITHAALRHGTNQMSKQLLVTAPLSILGGAFGEGGWKEQLTALGISFGLNGLMMKYSRGAESQADLGGVQALHASNYDPTGMATFFRKLEGLRKTEPGMLEAFFANHPPPEDREQAVQREISHLSSLQNPKRDSEEFHRIKSAVSLMPAPRAQSPQEKQQGSSQPQSVPEPSSRYVAYRHHNGLFRFEFPDNWQVAGEGEQGVTIVPPGGSIGSGNQSQISHGLLVNVADVGQESKPQDVTDEFLRQLIQDNSHLQEVRGSRDSFDLGGEKATRILLTGRSPATHQMENVWVITRKDSARLISFIFVSPENQFGTYKPVFNRILRSAQF